MPVVDADMVAVADSDLQGAGSVSWSASVDLDADSTITLNGVRQLFGGLSASGESDITLNGVRQQSGSWIVLGESDIMDDPTKITVVNFSRGPQVPVPVSVVVIPKIRAGGPVVIDHSFTVNPRRRR